MIWGMPPGLAEVWKGYDSAAFSKDGKLLALGGERVELGTVASSSWKRIRSIELPSTAPGERNGASANAGRGSRSSALAFSPHNNSIAVGYVDGTVRVVTLKP
jgi:WD40 repeat protein